MENIIQEPLRNKLVARTHIYKKGLSSLHWHQKFEIVRVLNKPCEFLVDGEHICAEVGDIITIDEHIVHQFQVKDSDTELLVLQFLLNLFIDASVPLVPLKKHIKISEMKKVPGLEEKISSLINMLLSEKSPMESNMENPFFKSIAMSLYYLLMRHFSEETSTKKSAGERNEFYRIVEYLNEHFTEEINVNVLSEKLYMSRKRLSRIFQKYSDMTVNAYITMLRLKRVNLLMKQGEEVTKAAYESGFQSVRTFNDIYKKQMGITPSEYKQQKETF